MKKALNVLLALFLIFSLLVGCSSNGGEEVNEGEGESSGEPSGDTVRQSIVRISADSTPVLDPAIGIGNASSISFVNLYDTLVFPTAEGVKPWIAESWDVSEDGTEYTFHLKQGVKFHDGSELLASDVKFSMDRMITIGEGFAYLYSGTVVGVTAEDDYTVTFKLNRSFGPFASTLARLYILNEDIVMANLADGSYGDYGDYGRDYLITHSAGSGPYMAKELVQQDYFLGTKFADWHAGWEEGAPEEFKIIYGTEPSTIRTLMANQQLEITDPWQSSENLKSLEKMDGVSLGKYTTRLVQNIYYNTTVAPTDDLKFRKALSHLFDYQMLVDQVFVDSKTVSSPVSNYTAGHIDVDAYDFDLEKAKELLAQSKYADSYSDMTIEFLVNSDIQDLEKVALAFQATAAQVGLHVEIVKAPWVTMQERISSPESAPNLTSINSAPQYNEAGATLESAFHSKTAGSYENATWYLSDELDARIEDALATTDKDERFQKYADIQEFVVNEVCPSTYIADLTERVAYQDTYLEWNVSEATMKGEIEPYLMGYPFFVPDMKIIQ